MKPPLWLILHAPNYKIVHTTREHYSRHFGGDHCDGRGARKYEREESIVRCLDYGTYCPQGDETLEAFLDNENRIKRVPANRVYVMNVSDADETLAESGATTREQVKGTRSS